MSAKSPATEPSWVDPDDAPELTDEMLAKATFKIGDRVVSREEYAAAFKTASKAATKMGRPKLERPKRPVTVRYDADVIDAFKATGPGWQTRMNDALREWLRTHGQG
ncbi:BrnA antitoxin family protein [Azohydromonas caseinilytica]|uniref:BrnA antitoxin family protein n=1 Tax=Azohydromonas caseinilytica TaxID=2728836 RepID=A0A848FCC7_9BURK|nr:BrnA antitoxin family protein [Azohydromonas caseinilytica]NML16415.1 BrnA antitoxin family protein [Azohydromonas caseinilytica]